MPDAATAPTAATPSLGCRLNAAVRAVSEPQPSSRITAARVDADRVALGAEVMNR